MLDFINKLFGGNRQEREVQKLWPVVEEINEKAQSLQSLSDEQLQAKTVEFKARIAEAVREIEEDQAAIHAKLKAATSDVAVGGDGQVAEGTTLTPRERQDLYDELDKLEDEWLEAVENVLDAIMVEAFAVVKETCKRFVGTSWEAGGSEVTWDMVPFDVQLLGGIVLHRGRIAEMKTGEGKTLTSVAPIYLNALVGRGVHLITVNPYLAQRDSEWMGPIFEFLGLTVDCVDPYQPHSPERKAAYEADITYGTNNEFGFDYLRDNSFTSSPEELVQRHHHFAIIDEVDSVLIDEARTPLIISGPVPQSDEDRYEELQPSVEKLVYTQQKFVASQISEAEKALKEAKAAREAEDTKKARALEEEAGVKLYRAQRGYPRSRRLIKLKGEPEIEQLIRQTEFRFLQDNAKHLPIVDDELYFALDEKQHTIEMSDKGTEYIAKVANEDRDFFLIPSMGDEIVKLENDYAEKAQALRDEIAALDLSEEKKQNKLDNDLHVLANEEAEARRQLDVTYAERAARIHAINQLLRAYTHYEKDVEYIVQDNKVMIVDVHTGRVLSGRRYSDGLHQAIEAKENVKIQAATQTYATITLQNYFRMYDKLAGMTGTAETEAEEFFKIYKLDVNVIPTNRPIQRADLEDLVYRSKREKYNAVIDKIREYHEKEQPVLVGTTNVEVSETLSRMLKRDKIPHNVLNAKKDRQKSEAMIVAEAGQPGAVTIATNMAGRGTDIKLAAGVADKGGLAIIGTERHESRRIDLQLRGRSGRQGDPGESQFFVSLEDDLMRLFGSDRTANIMGRLGMEEGEVITHSLITKSIGRAQKKVEQNNFGIRKRQLEYDDVLNAQRAVIYDRRMHALHGDRLHGDILDMLREVVDEVVEKHYGEGNLDEMREELKRELALDFDLERERFAALGEDGVQDAVYDAALEYYNRKRQAIAELFFRGLRQMVQNAPNEADRPKKIYQDFSDGRRLLRPTVHVEVALENEGQEINDALERVSVLTTIDQFWTEHLRELDELKEGINLRAFGQKDPLLEYKMEAFNLFKAMIGEINRQAVSIVFKAGPMIQGEGQKRAPRARTGAKLDRRRATAQHEEHGSYGVGNGESGSAERDPTAGKQPIVISEEDRIGRNDPCPCGSGKKYKHCHGRG